MRSTLSTVQSKILALSCAAVTLTGLHADEVRLLDGERVEGVVCVFAEDGGVVMQLPDGGVMRGPCGVEVP